MTENDVIAVAAEGSMNNDNGQKQHEDNVSKKTKLCEAEKHTSCEVCEEDDSSVVDPNDGDGAPPQNEPKPATHQDSTQAVSTEGTATKAHGAENEKKKI